MSHAVLEIIGSINAFSNHFDILSDPKRFKSDIWLSATYNVHLIHTHSASYLY